MEKLKIAVAAFAIVAGVTVMAGSASAMPINSQPTMKFVATKTADQLDLQALRHVRTCIATFAAFI
jgi:hypothetical protein